MSKDQKHSSDVAKRFYRKHLSRDIATQGKMCIEKMVGNSRTHEEKQLSNLLSTINSNNMLFDQSVVDHTEKLLGSSAYPISTVTDEGQPENNTTWIQNETHELIITHAFFVYYENADLVYDVIRMRQLSKQTLHELSPNDNS